MYTVYSSAMHWWTLYNVTLYANMTISAKIGAKSRPWAAAVNEEAEDFGGGAAATGGVSPAGAVAFLATTGSGGSTTSAALRRGGSATGCASNKKPGCTGWIRYGDPLVAQDDPVEK